MEKKGKRRPRRRLPSLLPSFDFGAGCCAADRPSRAGSATCERTTPALMTGRGRCLTLPVGGDLRSNFLFDLSFFRERRIRRSISSPRSQMAFPGRFTEFYRVFLVFTGSHWLLCRSSLVSSGSITCLLIGSLHWHCLISVSLCIIFCLVSPC